MNVTTAMAPQASALPAWRDPLAWARAADIVAVLIALFLPWSTSLAAIFAVVIWLIAVAPIDRATCVAGLR